MSIPTPWNDKNKCFVDTTMLSAEQLDRINYIDTSYTTYIRSNLAITDGDSAHIPNVFEAINVAYELVKATTLQMNAVSQQLSTFRSEVDAFKTEIANQISALQTSVTAINADIETMKEQIAALTPVEP